MNRRKGRTFRCKLCKFATDHADASNWVCRNGKAVGRVCIFCDRAEGRNRYHAANPDAKWNMRQAEVRGYDVPEGAKALGSGKTGRPKKAAGRPKKDTCPFYKCVRPKYINAAGKRYPYCLEHTRLEVKLRVKEVDIRARRKGFEAVLQKHGLMEKLPNS